MSNKPAIAICACGAKFQACDTVEALLHITGKSGESHHWAYIYTGVFEAGRLLISPYENPADYKAYLKAKNLRVGIKQDNDLP